MEPPFLPFDPDGDNAKSGTQHTRLRDIPLRAIFPQIITLLAICSGMTAIRFAVDGRLELAIGAVILAAFLDGIDGRVARFLKSTSRFGAQMDSLADFVNFGVAPAMILYFSLLNEIGPLGWLVGLVYALCACLRLARFNVMIEIPGSPAWQKDFFVGVPAPAAAGIALAPIYLLLLGVEATPAFAGFACAYLLAVGLLMISSLPTFAGKTLGQQIRREFVLPLLLLIVVFIAVLLSWPWETLLGTTVAYLASLPVAWHSWQQRTRAEHEAAQAPGKDNQ